MPPKTYKGVDPAAFMATSPSKTTTTTETKRRTSSVTGKTQEERIDVTRGKQERANNK